MCIIQIVPAVYLNFFFFLHIGTWQLADTMHSAEDGVILSQRGGPLSRLNCRTIGWPRRHTYVAQGSRLQIKLDCGQSDSIVFAGQDFQELTP